jgi:hypothetical protein
MYRNQDKKVQTKAAFAKRLQNSLKESGRTVSPTDLSAEFNARFDGPNVHIHSCRKWLLGDAIPTQEKLVVLAKMLGVTPDWLRFGDPAKAVAAPLGAATALNRKELALLADYQRLPARDQTILQNFVGVLLKTP